MISMNHPPRIGCLIMAAGNASRFGSNKLAAKVDGKMLIEHALETVPREEFARVTVVTQYDEVLVLARRFGFTVLVNPFPEWGASHTVRLGTEAMADCDAILYQVADQPLLRRESVRAEVEFFRRHPDRIVAMGHGGVRGNPCIFPARFFPELTALEGDRGGSAVIRRHEDALALFEVSPDELRDVDTPMALAALRDTLSRELRRRHFAAEVLLHQRLDALLLIAAGKKIVELGDGGLGRHVQPADRARPFQGVRGLVSAQRHRPLRTLRADRQHRAVVKGLFDDRQQRAAVPGNVPRAEGLDDDAAQPLGHDLLKERELNAREDLQHPDGNILQ